MESASISGISNNSWTLQVWPHLNGIPLIFVSILSGKSMGAKRLATFHTFCRLHSIPMKHI